jgi:hypothetical protein
VRVAGGLLFELTGHSIGDESRGEEDVAVVLRSWQAQNFLITSMHVKGIVQHLNVLGVMEVQVYTREISSSLSSIPSSMCKDVLFLFYLQEKVFKESRSLSTCMNTIERSQVALRSQ